MLCFRVLCFRVLCFVVVVVLYVDDRVGLGVDEEDDVGGGMGEERGFEEGVEEGVEEGNLDVGGGGRLALTTFLGRRATVGFNVDLRFFLVSALPFG